MKDAIRKANIESLKEQELEELRQKGKMAYENADIYEKLNKLESMRAKDIEKGKEVTLLSEGKNLSELEEVITEKRPLVFLSVGTTGLNPDKDFATNVGIVIINVYEDGQYGIERTIEQFPSVPKARLLEVNTEEARAQYDVLASVETALAKRGMTREQYIEKSENLPSPYQCGTEISGVLKDYPNAIIISANPSFLQKEKDGKSFLGSLGLSHLEIVDVQTIIQEYDYNQMKLHEADKEVLPDFINVEGGNYTMDNLVKDSLSGDSETWLKTSALGRSQLVGELVFDLAERSEYIDREESLPLANKEKLPLLAERQEERVKTEEEAVKDTPEKEEESETRESTDGLSTASRGNSVEVTKSSSTTPMVESLVSVSSMLKDVASYIDNSKFVEGSEKDELLMVLSQRVAIKDLIENLENYNEKLLAREEEIARTLLPNAEKTVIREVDKTEKDKAENYRLGSLRDFTGHKTVNKRVDDGRGDR